MQLNWIRLDAYDGIPYANNTKIIVTYSRKEDPKSVLKDKNKVKRFIHQNIGAESRRLFWRESKKL